MAERSGGGDDGPAFPPELLKDLLQAAPDGAKLRLVAAGGAAVTVARIVKESDRGLIVESVEGQLTAIPWHVLLRADTVRPDAGRAVGFRPD
ncbi:MAG TPA: hypothetical protein VNM16_07125 [Bacillota bacterium]|nr:hypothetical protein [Bacillota bacterium]